MVEVGRGEPYVPAGACVNAVARREAPNNAICTELDGKLGRRLHVQAENKVKPRLTPQEALIYAMVTVAAADRKITEHELVRINIMVRELPAFRGIEDTWLSHEAQNCGQGPRQTRRGRDGRKHDRRALPHSLRETAYALAAEVAASDLVVKDDERNFLTLLAKGCRSIRSSVRRWSVAPPTRPAIGRCSSALTMSNYSIVQNPITAV